MEVALQLDADDYAHYAACVGKAISEVCGSAPRFAWLLRLKWAALGLAIIASCYAVAANEIESAGHFYAALCFAVIWVATQYAHAFFYRRLSARWMKRADVYYYRPQTVRIEVSGVTITRAHSVSSYDWAAFAGYRRTWRAYLLFLGADQAINIPCRAIAPEDITPFEELIQAHLSFLGEDMSPRDS